jgi:hypothetical protein
MRKAIPFLYLLLVSGCASGLHSYVDTLTPADAKVIGEGVVVFVKERASPNSGAIALEGPHNDALLAPEIQTELEAAGYKVGEDGARHRLRYQVMTLDDGMLVRLSLDSGDAARFYQRSFGTLSPSGPFTFREAAR